MRAQSFYTVLSLLVILSVGLSGCGESGKKKNSVQTGAGPGLSGKATNGNLNRREAGNQEPEAGQRAKEILQKSGNQLDEGLVSSLEAVEVLFSEENSVTSAKATISVAINGATQTFSGTDKLQPALSQGSSVMGTLKLQNQSDKTRQLILHIACENSCESKSDMILVDPASEKNKKAVAIVREKQSIQLSITSIEALGDDKLLENFKKGKEELTSKLFTSKADTGVIASHYFDGTKIFYKADKYYSEEVVATRENTKIVISQLVSASTSVADARATMNYQLLVNDKPLAQFVSAEGMVSSVIRNANAYHGRVISKADYETLQAKRKELGLVSTEVKDGSKADSKAIMSQETSAQLGKKEALKALEATFARLVMTLKIEENKAKN